MLQPLHPSSSSCQNKVSKGDQGKVERFWKGGESSQIKNVTEDGSEQKPLLNPTVTDRSCGTHAKAEHALPNSESPEAILQPSSTRNIKPQSQAPKTSKETLLSPSSSQEGLLQDTSQIVPAGICSPTQAPAQERQETVNMHEEKDELEEEDLRELLSKLMDTFTLEMSSGKIFTIMRVMARDSGLLKYLIL